MGAATQQKHDASVLGITSECLRSTGLIDGEVNEPLGGAHRDFSIVCDALKKELTKKLQVLSDMDRDDLLQARYEKLFRIGDIQTWKTRM